jgi:hypothetical protein
MNGVWDSTTPLLYIPKVLNYCLCEGDGTGGYNDECYTWFSSVIPNYYISKRTKYKKYKGNAQRIHRAHDCTSNTAVVHRLPSCVRDVRKKKKWVLWFFFQNTLHFTMTKGFNKEHNTISELHHPSRQKHWERKEWKWTGRWCTWHGALTHSNNSIAVFRRQSNSGVATNKPVKPLVRRQLLSALTSQGCFMSNLLSIQFTDGPNMTTNKISTLTTI